jgi:hypothetical protein
MSDSASWWLYHLFRLTFLSSLDVRALSVAFSCEVMSYYVQLAVRAPQQSVSEVTAPGIVGLFVQGFQTGLVVSQLAQWLNLKRKESALMIALVTFVTVVGL